jgi:D-threo-aldose 1-dehydrogenase
MIDISQTKPLSNTGLQLPIYGLGTAHIGNAGEATAIETVQEALTRGIKFIDTAPLYPPANSGKSEIYVGKALAGVPRESYVLATKVGRLIRDGKPVFDFSREGVLRSLEESLARLKVDYIDILHVHDPDNHFEQALNEAFPAIIELREQGVIKAVGSGMNQWQMLREFALNTAVNCFLLAGRYTLLEQTSLEFLKLCQEKNIAIILGGVYNSGILVSDLQPGASYNYAAAPPEILERARKLAAVCQRHNVPLHIAAIQFVYAHPAVTSIVVGAEEKAHVVANLAALQVPIPAQLWADLQQEGLLEPGTPTPV